LVKALGMLGSDHVRERDKAGRTAERVWIRENGIWRQETIRDEHHGFGDDEDLDDDELDDDDLDDEEYSSITKTFWRCTRSHVRLSACCLTLPRKVK
jgi:hypothetical protein